MKKTALLALSVLLLAGCGRKEEPVRLELPGWADDVRTGINEFLSLYGEGGRKHHDGTYVVFDFDNTTSIFDIQYQMVPFQPLVMAF